MPDKKQQQTPPHTINNARRGFLKKAVYSAPTIVALGALTKPTESEAGAGKPPSGPTWG